MVLPTQVYPTCLFLERSATARLDKFSLRSVYLTIMPGSFPLAHRPSNSVIYARRSAEGEAVSLHGPIYAPGAIRCLVNAIVRWHVFTTVVITIFFKSTSRWQTPVWPADVDFQCVIRFLLESIAKFSCWRVSKQTMWREVRRAGVWSLNTALWWKYRTWCQKFGV